MSDAREPFVRITATGALTEPDEFSLSHPISRRQALKFAAASLSLLVTRVGFAAEEPASILGVRVWPARDYTRVTLEYRHNLKYTQMMVSNPPRLVVDIEGVEFNSVLKSLPGKISETDPYIKLIRAGRNRPGVVRLVIELKTEVKPQVFTLPPVGEYGHRLVLDLYPAHPVDPLMALIEQTEKVDAENRPSARNKSADADNRGGERNGKPAVSRMITIMLDPGHGGEDPGAIGQRGTYEKTVVLEIAKRLRAKIDAEPNMRTAMTRDSDFFVPLGQRVQKARRINADLFVSIHADAFIKRTARGSSVFALSEHGASSAAARWMANKENASDLIGGVSIGAGRDPYLAKTLLDLSQTATITDSLKLGKDVLKQIGTVNDLHSDVVEQAGFAVLKAPDIPSILVETAFISNPEEELRLLDDSYQDRLTDALLHGIKLYFAQNPPLGRSRQV